MKLKKLLVFGLIVGMTLSMFGCGKKDNPTAKQSNEATVTQKPDGGEAKTEGTGSQYSKIVLGETGTDIRTTIKWLDHRTDLETNGKLAEYVSEFNKLYPNITVKVEVLTDYANASLLRLSSSDWGDIMMIPAVAKGDITSYFESYGTYEELNKEYNYITNWMYEDQIYGLPSTANAQGILYNKKVFEKAGITTIPKTPDEFIAALQAIKDKTDAIPLYTNYAAEWTMGAWDAYIGGSATGNKDYANLVLPYEANPFKDRGDATGPYALYKVLYDAVDKGLIEDDYTTTDWEGCKGMLNRGEIGTMVLGSWAVPQMQQAGDNPDDIGYMTFPITIDGKQYASAGPDYNYGINVKASDENKLASMIFVKFMVDKSGFAYDEGGLPALRSDTKLPATYAAFDGVEFLVDTPAKTGQENDLSELNAESELNINLGGNRKIMEIVEHAANKDKSFEDIMNEWNKAWSDAQTALNIEISK